MEKRIYWREIRAKSKKLTNVETKDLGEVPEKGNLVYYGAPTTQRGKETEDCKQKGKRKILVLKRRRLVVYVFYATE
jgi:hypothetical protein